MKHEVTIRLVVDTDDYVYPGPPSSGPNPDFVRSLVREMIDNVVSWPDSTITIDVNPKV